MSELRRRSDGRKFLVQKNQMIRRKGRKAPAKIRKEVMATLKMKTKDGVPMIKLLKRQGISKEGSNLHVEVGMKTIISYLTLRI